MKTSEKKQVMQGAFWKFLERIAAQLVSLIVSIILARIISPSEYGTVSLVTVFVTIATVFVNSGFGQALIQKKDADSVDFSSVFYFSLMFTGILYMFLFFAAVPIASFYDMPVLIPILRVLSINVPIMGINSIQQAYVSRHMKFKKFFYATFIGTCISAVVGIFMAYIGFGVWALVAQTLTNSIIDTIILQITIGWKITLEFSFDRISKLLSYGWKLLVQSFVLQIYTSLRSLMIGKFYTTSDLSFYTKGNQFPDLISTNIDTAINTALFPAMAKNQESLDRVKIMARKTVTLTSYIMNPILVGFMAIAEPFVRFLLTEKWLPCVPYLRICCIILLFRAPQSAIIQAVKAIGRSDKILKYDIPVRIFALIILLISLRYNIFYFALSEIVTTVLGTILYITMSKKTINYGVMEVCKDFISNILMSVIMGVFVYFIGELLQFPTLLIVLVQIVSGILIYIILSIFIKSQSYYEVLNIMTELIKSKIKRGRIDV